MRLTCTGCEGGQKIGSIEVLCARCWDRFADAERLRSIANWARDPHKWAIQKRPIPQEDRAVLVALGM